MELNSSISLQMQESPYAADCNCSATHAAVQTSLKLIFVLCDITSRKVGVDSVSVLTRHLLTFLLPPGGLSP